jgi:ribonuclease HII
MVKKIIGIDEAGRGPLIGPMVMAGVKISENKLADISCMGIKDSKLLSFNQREKLFDIIMNSNWIEYHIEISWPKEIDDALNSKNMNLNLLEALHTAMIINKLKCDEAILDLPSNNSENYIRSVKKFMFGELKTKCEIIAEHKADMNYAIVGAASIIAKVTRDRLIETLKHDIKIKFGINDDFGSGYPSDPKTT